MQDERTYSRESPFSLFLVFLHWACFNFYLKTENHTEICLFVKKTDKRVIGSSKEAANLNYMSSAKGRVIWEIWRMCLCNYLVLARFFKQKNYFTWKHLQQLWFQAFFLTEKEVARVRQYPRTQPLFSLFSADFVLLCLWLSSLTGSVLTKAMKIKE